MNYYGSKELAASFRTVRKNTIIIATEIPEDKYGFRPAPETRTVAQLLTHISLVTRMPLQIHSVERLRTFEGFDFMAFFGPLMAAEQNPASKADILAALESEGDRFAKFLDGCTEEFLAETVTAPPGAGMITKSRFEMLLGAKEHEMHHRGQLMLIERMIGIVPHLTREFQARFAAQAAGKK